MEEKNATLLAYLQSKSINEYGGILCLLHEKLKVWWNFFPKKLSEHARLLGTSDYVANFLSNTEGSCLM
jgi:hypothetical protein